MAARRLRALGIARPEVIGVAGERNYEEVAGEPAEVEGTSGSWVVDAAAVGQPFEGRTALLSPFDRLIHDRVRAQELFDFEYYLEMYKPKDKRRWGYFALPVLHNDQLVGKLDAIVDRKAKVLRVDAIHEDVRFTRAITKAVNAEIEALAAWLGLAGSTTRDELRLSQEEPLLTAEVRRPCEPVGAREAEIRAQCVTHRVDEPVSTAWREPILPPDTEHIHARLVPVDSRLDPADEPVPEDDRQDVPAPTALLRWEEELPDVVEVEQAPEEGPIPHDRIERGNERDGRRRVRRRRQEFGVLLDDEAFPADALDVDGNEISAFDELVA